MITSKYLKVNAPNIVHETIDGETILLDLKSGNYYSLDGAGAVIWDCLTQIGNWEKVRDMFSQKNISQKKSIDDTIEKFIANLVEEGLLVPTDDVADFSSDGVKDFEKNIEQAASNFIVPVVNKYSDMQDLLLLDPIHDVDEKGWPEAQEPKEEEEPS
jgi:hypothetical protein